MSQELHPTEFQTETDVMLLFVDVKIPCSEQNDCWHQRMAARCPSPRDLACWHHSDEQIPVLEVILQEIALISLLPWKCWCFSDFAWARITWKAAQQCCPWAWRVISSSFMLCCSLVLNNHGQAGSTTGAAALRQWAAPSLWDCLWICFIYILKRSFYSSAGIDFFIDTWIW